MLDWVGRNTAALSDLGNLFEIAKHKTAIGTVKYVKVHGVELQAWVKVSTDPKAPKGGWLYWTTVDKAKGYGVKSGDIVPIVGGKPQLPAKGEPKEPEKAPEKPAEQPKPAHPAGAFTTTEPEKSAPPKHAPPKEPEAEPEKEPEKKPPVHPEAPPAAVHKPEPKAPEKEPEKKPALAPQATPSLTAIPKAPTTTEPEATAGLKKLWLTMPVGSVRYRPVKAGGPLLHAEIKWTNQPKAKFGGWRYLMTVAAAKKAGVNPGDVVSFEIDPATNKLTPHKDDAGNIKKIKSADLKTAAALDTPVAPDKPSPEVHPEIDPAHVVASVAVKPTAPTASVPEFNFTTMQQATLDHYTSLLQDHHQTPAHTAYLKAMMKHSAYLDIIKEAEKDPEAKGDWNPVALDLEKKNAAKFVGGHVFFTTVPPEREKILKDFQKFTGIGKDSARGKAIQALLIYGNTNRVLDQVEHDPDLKFPETSVPPEKVINGLINLLKVIAPGMKVQPDPVLGGQSISFSSSEDHSPKPATPNDPEPYFKLDAEGLTPSQALVCSHILNTTGYKGSSSAAALIRALFKDPDIEVAKHTVEMLYPVLGGSMVDKMTAEIVDNDLGDIKNGKLYFHLSPAAEEAYDNVAETLYPQVFGKDPTFDEARALQMLFTYGNSVAAAKALQAFGLSEKSAEAAIANILQVLEKINSSGHFVGHKSGALFGWTTEVPDPSAAPKKPEVTAPPPTTPPPPDEKTTKLLAKLKAMGFDDPKTQANLLKSPSVQAALATAYGKDWKDKYIQHGGTIFKDVTAAPVAAVTATVLKFPNTAFNEISNLAVHLGLDPEGNYKFVTNVLVGNPGAPLVSILATAKHHKIDASAVMNLLGLFKDKGWVDTTTTAGDVTYKLNDSFYTATKEAPSAEGPTLEFPLAVPVKVKAALDAHNIEPSSSAGVALRVLAAHGSVAFPYLKDTCQKAGVTNPETVLVQLQNQGLVEKKVEDSVLHYQLAPHFWEAPTAAAPSVPTPAKPKAKKVTKKAPDLNTPPPVSVAAGPPITLAPAKYKIPVESDLSYVQSGKHLGGQGEKHIYKDKEGQDWLFKVAELKGGGGQIKPYAAHVQEAFSAVSMQVKSGSLPIKVTTLNGKLGTIQPMIDATGHLEQLQPSQLTAQQREDVASEHVLDWLMSQHDTYAGNLVQSKDGRVLGVDKEQAFRFFGTDKLDTSYNPNPIEPYYNQFWKDWAANKFAFDPKVLRKYFDRIDAISEDDYRSAMAPYATALWDDKPKEQAKFLAEAVARKNSTRADFEAFVTDLYKKRTGSKGGLFTFDQGWVPGEAAEKQLKAKTKTFTYTAEQVANDYGFQTLSGWKPKGSTTLDTTKRGIRIHKDPSNKHKEKLLEFAKEAGLTPWVPPDSNSDPSGIVIGETAYDWMFFDAAAWDKAAVKKTKAIVISDSVGAHSGIPEYHIPVFEHPETHPNLHELAYVDNSTLGCFGKRFTSDGGDVEHQCLKVQRCIDPDGNAYYQFHCKLRQPAWQKYLNKGTSGSWSFYNGHYDDHKDAVVQTHSEGGSASTRKWKHGNSEVHICTSSTIYSYMGGVYAKIVPSAGQTPVEAFRAAMNEVDPELATKLLTPPTAEDREIQRLARLLWAAAPQVHDKLTPEGFSVSNLKKKLHVAGWDDGRISKTQEQEVFPGYSAWVAPNRWKAMNVAYVCENAYNIQGFVGSLKFALAGGHERNLSGAGDQDGNSVGGDLKNGSGDGILGCVIPKTSGALGKSIFSLNGWSSGTGLQLIYTPDVMDRLDCYMHENDQWGCCRPEGDSHSHKWKTRKTVETFVKDLNTDYSGHEINFRKGISSLKLARVVTTSEQTRKNAILAAKTAGIHHVNGVPIEDFIIVASKGQDVYDKCIKPLGY